jgi:hypothetical protein
MNARVALLGAAILVTMVSMTLSAAPATRPAGEAVEMPLLPAPPVDPNLTRPAPPGFRPFTIDHHGRVDSAADVSFLLKAPAGKDGFITVRNGHLVYPNGQRFRIWGVNLTGWTAGSTNLPPKAEAPLWAAEMARYGINAVRFHFLDMPSRTTRGVATQPAESATQPTEAATQPAGGRGRRPPPSGLIDSSRDDTQAFDPDALDRLDFFIAELKKRGIYSNLNLNVGRTYKPGDNVPDSQLIRQGKAMTYIGPRLLELQRDYARQLLTHRNPYTDSTYADEPAIVTVELVNENSVYEFWSRNWLRGERVPGGANPMLDLTPYYFDELNKQFNAWLRATKTPEELAELRTLAGVKEGQPVPRLRRGDFAGAPAKRFHAEADFYAHLETSFMEEMKKYLRESLGVKSVIVGTADHTYWIPNLPLLRSTSRMDSIDGHAYWQHPAIWGERNTPMVNDPLHSTVVKLARSPMVNKPYIVSEVNHPNPNEYACEMIPILASYAAFQDWDGIYVYTFETKSMPGWQPFVEDNFDIAQDPVKMIQMELGALIFLRGDVKPAREVFARSYSAAQVNETSRMSEAQRPYFTPGFPLSLPLRHGSRIQTLDGEPTKEFPRETFNPDNDVIRSDTGELAWSVAREKGGLFTIDTPRTQALVGFVKANRETTTKHLRVSVTNDFCAISLSALDAKPINCSNTLLLTAASRIQNTGTVWNDRHTLWSTWGTPPTLIEQVTGWVTLREMDGAVDLKVIPLDGAAKPIGRPISGHRNEDGWEVPLGDAATTFYLVQVTR